MTKVYKPIPHLPEKLFYGKIICWLLMCALFALFTFWVITKEHRSFIVWLFQSAPLLALIPGMLKEYYRSYSWLCFVLLFYFIIAVESALISTSTFSDYIFVTLVVLLFLSSMMTSRWLQRTQKQHLIQSEELQEAQ